MSSKARKLSFSLAINEALRQTMAEDPSVMLIGQGVKSPWYVGNTANGLLDEFGPDRVIDTPVSENAITGSAVGAAIAGMRPVIVHPRMDFMMYGLDPIINQAANWHYMCGGRTCVPVVVWGIINRKGEQAAQHSQALHAMFAHIPGLKVVAPTTAYDAKGLMVAAIRDDNPVVFVDDRMLYREEGPVPEELYEVPIGEAAVRREGADVTLVAVSHMQVDAMQAAYLLSEEGIDVEVIDPRTLKPLDVPLIVQSVKKTGRLLVVDGGWKTCGYSAEIAALAAEECFAELKAPVKRLALPDCPAPASKVLEEAYYITCQDIASAAKAVVEQTCRN